ncbi:uncharacterized protein LOC132515319 [Lagenorhynchus albirostris]|uniref:uncharacterized protein LOC132515319 n=1 Tax=Lagenorhynchus albirostris TaxID=27610 RepID=UPI0028EC9CD8|nr:uncharacterized protein LOC132515319 [Lagenorhynchus albirostris]
MGASVLGSPRAERAWGHLYRAPLPPGLQTSVQSPRCCLPTWHACAHTGTRAHMSRLSHSPAQGGLQPQGHCPCTPDGTTPHGPGLGPVGGVCLGGLPNIWQKPLRDGSPALPRFLEAGDGRKKRRCPSPLTGSCLGLLHVHLTNQPEGVLCMSGRAPPTLVLPSASCGAVPAALPTQRTPWAGAPLSSGCVCLAQGEESDRNACSGKNEARLLEKEHRKRVLGLQPSDAPASLLQPFMLPLPPGAQGPHTHLPAQFPFPLSSTLPHKSPSQPAPDSGASSISSWLLPASQGPICLCFSPAFLLPTSTGSSIPKHTPPGPPSMACLAADIPRIEACFSWTVPPGSYGLSP